MRRLNDEDGATAVVVALLLVVLFGSAAFAVDVGQIYQERRELQNGADAAAMAAAYDCAKGVISCSITGLELNTTVDDYANDNANDAASDAEIVGLDLTGQSITVRTSTRSGGNGFLTHWFAGVLGHPNTTVTAEATANWGRVPGTLEIFPLAFCQDTFWEVTNTRPPNSDMTDDFPGPPAYHVFYKTPSEPIACPTTSGTYDGGFGWLDIDGANFDASTCTLTISTSQWARGTTGAAARSGGDWPTCYQKLRDRIDQTIADPTGASPLLVPIFDDWNPDLSGANGEFHIDGFGAFHPTGYNFPGTNYPDNSACINPSKSCMRGWFTDYIAFGGVGTGGTYYGVVSVDLVK